MDEVSLLIKEVGTLAEQTAAHRTHTDFGSGGGGPSSCGAAISAEGFRVLVPAVARGLLAAARLNALPRRRAVPRHRAADLRAAVGPGFGRCAVQSVETTIGVNT